MSSTKCLALLAAIIVLISPAFPRDRQSTDAQKSLSAPAVSGQSGASASKTSGAQPPADSKQQAATAGNFPAKDSPQDAWALLMQGASSARFRDRSDALSALTILDRDRKAIAVISSALDDKEETIRVLAATSLGEIKARAAIPKLKQAMDEDKSPQVNFAAAQALWKMGDHSGRDVFYDVLDGERKVKPGLVKSKMHQARMEMHDPKALALIGVNEASGAFLGPFSMGVSVVEEYAKNSGTSVQALCAQLLAADDSHDTVEELTYALGDNNWTLRAAAARSLAKLNIRGALLSLKSMMVNDKSQPARFAAAAAVIHLSGSSSEERSRAKIPGVKAPAASPSPEEVSKMQTPQAK